MKPGYCLFCGGRVAVLDGGPSVVAGEPDRPIQLLDPRTMQPHRCDPDDVKAMAPIYDSRAPEPDR